MEKETQAIRDDIAQTRGRLEDTVDAIAHKSDIGARASDAIPEHVDSVKSTLTNALESASDIVENAKAKLGDGATQAVENAKSSLDGVSDKVRGALPSTADAKAALQSTGAIAKSNPLGLAIGAFAIGLIAGSFLPVSKLEQERAEALGDRIAESATGLLSEKVGQTIGAFRNARTGGVNGVTYGQG